MAKYKRFPKNITIGDKYRPAMEIDNQADADEYFERCVEHTVFWFGYNRSDAEQIELSNIGYFAGYYDSETAAWVYKLFKAAHPIFGTTRPTMKEAYEAGVCIGQERNGNDVKTR
jgi:hypothetical protein